MHGRGWMISCCVAVLEKGEKAATGAGATGATTVGNAIVGVGGDQPDRHQVRCATRRTDGANHTLGTRSGGRLATLS
jgi:hypothetical protein